MNIKRSSPALKCRNQHGGDRRWSPRRKRGAFLFGNREGRGVPRRGKTGSVCHFAFSLVLQCLGVPRYPGAGKNSTKSVIVTRLVVCPKFRVFLNPWFGEPVVCTLDSRGFRHFRGFRDFRESSTQLLVCS